MNAYDAPNDLCEAVKLMFIQHGEVFGAALKKLEEIQFTRFSATNPTDTQARENIYFSMLGAREFYGYLELLAAQAKSNAEKPASPDHQ